MFDIENSVDYFRMLIEDFDEFMNDQQSTRKAIHCAITAYHLGDWVWHDWLKKDEDAMKNIGVVNKKSFWDYLSRSANFSVLREVVNGSKHFARQSIETQVSQGFGQGPYGVGPYSIPYLLIDLGEWDVNSDDADLDEFGEADFERRRIEGERYLPAVNLLAGVVEFWQDFFKKNCLSPVLTRSAHLK